MKMTNPVKLPTAESCELHATEIEAMAEHFHTGSALETMLRVATGYRRLAERMRVLETNELELMRGWRIG